MLKNKIKNYAQWFPGSMNDVSDALSRGDNRSNEELINIFRTFTPSQIPDHFKIVPLPREISSWLTSLLQRLPVKEQSRGKHTRTKLGRGQGGTNTAVQLELSRTNSLTTSGVDKESDSWEPLPWLSVKGDFHDHLMKPWLKEQSEVPSHLSHRPSGKMTGQTQLRTRMAFCCAGFVSLFLKALYCLDIALPSSPSSSLVGFCPSFSLKVCETNEMAPLTVPSDRVS